MTRQVFPRALAFKLAAFLEARYVEAALTDGKFAELATHELAFPVTERNVAGVRTDLGIAPTRPRGVLTSTKRLIERVEALEARLAQLEADLGVRRAV